MVQDVGEKCSPRVLELLKGDPSAKGTVEHLKIYVVSYLEVFLSRKKSIESRIESAGPATS
jgi:hypothetical protein